MFSQTSPVLGEFCQEPGFSSVRSANSEYWTLKQKAVALTAPSVWIYSFVRPRAGDLLLADEEHDSFRTLALSRFGQTSPL